MRHAPNGGAALPCRTCGHYRHYRLFFLWRSFQTAGAWLLACAALALATGCAHPPASALSVPLPERSAWSGRLALQVQDQAAQSFSASFELQGSAQSGELKLFTPFGSVLAQMDWAPGRARLQSSGEVRESDSLQALLAQTLGTPLPVEALFAWLRGTQTTASGWQADLSALDSGRLVATRHEPAPQAVLRVVFEH